MAKKGIKHRRNEKALSVLAKNLKKYRALNHLTIQAVADRLDIDYSQISRMERGIVNPNISIIFDIAEIFEIKAYQLLEE